MKSLAGAALIFLALFVSVESCNPDPIEDTEVDQTELYLGVLQVDFKISHVWIPPSRIIRVAFHVAADAQHLYRGDYLQSANVTDNMQFYTFHLAPGTYYYEAIIACICEKDSCSAGGFPGNQFAKKHTMGKFTIKNDENTLVKPTFQ